MTDPRIAPYGAWRSPISAERVAAGSVNFGPLAVDGGDLYWLEQRPRDAGRTVLVRRAADGRIGDVTLPSVNVRSGVHDYGGGAFAVADGTVCFSNFSDHRLYRQDGLGPARALTADGPWRYADLHIDHRRRRVLCVREDHSAAGREPVNALVAVALDRQASVRVLASGNDFYSSPRLTADGASIAWLSWNHPNMPWDGTDLWAGVVADDGSIDHVERIAGGADESVFQPEWGPDGSLYFVSDRTGWWNLYRWRRRAIEPLGPMAADCGVPQWAFGLSTYAVLPDGRVICSYSEEGHWRLALVDPATMRWEMIETPFSDISFVRAAERRAVFVGASPTRAPAVVAFELTRATVEIVRPGSAGAVDSAYLSAPRFIRFASTGGLTAYAFFYAPHNDEFSAPADERPPLLVFAHGGPTSACTGALKLAIQYWTSRGIAVVDVNYGGSSGFGRSYRRRLDGQWGVVDVDDCVNAARYLVERGAVDPDRVAIRGGSAGGYTTLCALAFRKVFRAGASYYGVGDLESLARDTHKFESRYLDRLVAPYPAGRELYRARSPIHAVDQLSCPVIFFQGLEDRVVPPSQSETMVAALRAKKLPVAYLTFPTEQHGFRSADTRRRTLEAELYFYSRILGFSLADAIEPVAIDA